MTARGEAEPGVLAPGAVLRGRFEVVREIGRGGYSVVYLVRDRELASEVALKLLVPPPAAAQVARERMRREVQVVRSLSHPNIVAVFDFLEDGPWSFIVMEYVPGPDLHVRVHDRGRLGADEAVRVGRDMAAALSTAHRRGILHRDVKPQNILLAPDGRARLTDFGSARLDGQIGVTASGTLAGTLAYTAPEVLAGRRGDARADVYALGLTLYFALSGDLPARSSPHLPPTAIPGGFRPGQAVDGVPVWLDDLVAHATTAAAEDRYPTAAALDEALARSGASSPFPGVSREPCLLCGGPDPLSLGLCPACGGSPEAADTVVFLRRAAASDRRGTARRLETVLPELGPHGARAAVARERPLFRLPSAGTARLLDALERRELAADAIPLAHAGRSLPPKLWLMAAAIGAAGWTAGSAVMPALLWTTPVMAGLVLLGARQAARTPLVAARRRPAALPRGVERTVVETLAVLPEGTSRHLFADVTRLSASLFERLARSGDDRELAPVLAELVAAAAGAARDLADLDANLLHFERQRERFAAMPAGWLDALGRCERTRDALVQRLLEAVTAVGRLRSQQAELAAESEPSLVEATRALADEAKAQAAAASEIAELLGSEQPTS